MYATGEPEQTVLQGCQPCDAVLNDDVTRVQMRHHRELALLQEVQRHQDLSAHLLDLVDVEAATTAPVFPRPVLVPAVALDLRRKGGGD